MTDGHCVCANHTEESLEGALEAAAETLLPWLLRLLLRHVGLLVPM